MRWTARIPARLGPGDTVALVAPAAAVERESLERGAATLEALGYRVRIAREAGRRHRYLAGTDPERAASLLAAMEGADVRAVFFARAGYGTARILPLVAPRLRRLAPKIVVGYSDATALLDWLTGALGWVTFHGPMPATDSARPSDLHSLRSLLAGEAPRPLRVRSVLREGRAEGPLVGGCLSIVASLLGTPWALAPPRGAVLFLEDRNEKPYRLDRLLVQLRFAGLLDRIGGIVFGEMPECGSLRELRAIVAEATDGLDVPIAFGLASGHGSGKRTLALGARTRLDTSSRLVELLEPVVR